jgi:hypothetical protein
MGQDTTGFQINLTDIVSDYEISNPDIKMQYNDGMCTLVFIVKKKDGQIAYKTYMGLNELSNQATYENLSCEDGLENSFDHLDEYVCVVDVQPNVNRFDVISEKLYNLNVDVSYLPQFSGYKGFHDYTYNQYVKKDGYVSLQLMGQSTDLLADIHVNVDELGMFSLENLENLYDYICGRVYEDFNEKTHNFNSFIMEKMPWKGFSQECEGEWSVDFNLSGLDPQKLSAYYIIVGNKYTGSKNLYYVGSFIDISSINEGNELTEGFLSLRDDLKTYTNEPPESEIVDGENQFVTIGGTYSIGEEWSNRVNTNYMHGVDDILIKFEGSNNNLMFKFITKEEWLIRENELYVAAFNPSELRMFEWYHLFEPVNINQLSLSAIELSDYSSISEISCLSGYDSLAFKYSEEDTFSPSDMRYWFPGYNRNHPIRLCDIFDNIKNKYKVLD